MVMVWITDPFSPKFYFLIQNNIGMNFVTCEQTFIVGTKMDFVIIYLAHHQIITKVNIQTTMKPKGLSTSKTFLLLNT